MSTQRRDRDSNKRRYDYDRISNTQIVVDGLRFGHKSSIYYTCVKCKCTVKLDKDYPDSKVVPTQGNEVVHNLGFHNAQNIEEAVEIETRTMEHTKDIEEMGKMLVTHPGMRNAQIVQGTKFSNVSSHTLSATKYRYMDKMKLPRQLSDIQNMNMVLFYDNDNSICFGRVSSLFILSQSPVILEDGTFNIVNNDGQLFILHGKINEKFVSCLYIKMKSRRSVDYLRVFDTIEKMAQDRHITIFNRPLVMKGDFEKAVIKVINDKYTNVQFNGCFFHLTYNIMKHLEENHLKELYNIDPNFNQLIRRICCLALLPVPFSTTTNVKSLISSFKRINIVNNTRVIQSDDFKNFKDYLLNNWFKNYSTALSWNVSETSIRSNNISESSHSVLDYDRGAPNTVLSMIKKIICMMKRDEANVRSAVTQEIFTLTLEENRNVIIETLQTLVRENKMYFRDFLDSASRVLKMKTKAELDDFEQREFDGILIADTADNNRRRRKVNERHMNAGYVQKEYNRHLHPFNVQRDAPITTDLSGVRMREATTAEVTVGDKVRNNTATIDDIYSCDLPLDDLSSINWN